ncbi:MAG TPA: MarR family transcriptional regulator [Oligoflexia bacterium]|nr:MarR family transcriptional regulator [Oligoflexia bacterium]HMR25082.1 MarR family transcriptional regulator [Oligoflexia bacterium]
MEYKTHTVMVKAKTTHAMSKNNKSSVKQVSSDAGYDYDLRILHALRQIMRSVDIHSRQLNQRYDITTPQLVCLLAISEHGPLTIASLSQKVHLSPSTLVGIIDRLEIKKWLTRKRDVDDRRKIYLHITKSGSKFVSEAPSPLQETLLQALSDLNHKEQSTLAVSLERIVELMKVKELDAAPILHI